MTQAIHGILFDLGDTLLNYGKLDILRLFEEGAQLSYAYLKELGASLPAFDRYHRSQLHSIKWNVLKSRFIRRDFSSRSLLALYSESQGHVLSDAQIDELAWLWYQPLSRFATTEEGLRETLVAFRDRGLTLGLVSNTFLPPSVLDRHLDQFGLLELLTVRVYSSQTRYHKPHPKIFRAALDQAGLDAAATLFVGNQFKTDIRGANRAGCISVLKDPTGTQARWFTKPRYRIRKIAELAEIIARHNGDGPSVD